MALLKGQHGLYEKIPFVPLPVEYVAKEDVRSDAASAVEAELPTVITAADHKELAANIGMHGLGGATSSSSDDSEVDKEDDSSHNSRAAVQGAAVTEPSRSVLVCANAPARAQARTRTASSQHQLSSPTYYKLLEGDQRVTHC